jgi:hypothetical protein
MNVQRAQLAKFLPDNESIRIFEELLRQAERADRNAGQIRPILSDVSASNTTLVESGILLPVATGFIYRFEFFGAYTVASAAVGSRWVITGPAASTLAYTSDWSLTGTTRTTNELSAYSLPAAANASSASTAGNIVRINGMITPSAAGNISLSFASGAASAVTLKAGAFGRLIRLT